MNSSAIDPRRRRLPVRLRGAGALTALPPLVVIPALTALTVLAPMTPALAADNLELIPDYALFGLGGTGHGLGDLWIMLIAFVLLIFPLNALIFKPIFAALDARADRIQGARERSDALETEADSVLERYEAAIREARGDSETARQEQLGRAREKQQSLTTQARGEAEQELEGARASLNASLEDARASLRASAEELAQAAAEQVLGRAL